ncbi:MAG: glycosyltransferase family 39 protein [bacterium]|jgi:4-amino-4-deoxy-L-arabinose transferase-like glycosyltransferase|nr:glycosyltransferase family 39 protein [bacterium]
MALNRNDRIALVGLVLLAWGVRWVGLDRLSLWTDEIHSVFLTRFSLFDYFLFPQYFDHPPFYFLLLKIWMRFGQSDAWIRFLSVIAASMTVIPLYGFVKEWGGSRAALYASLFLVLNPLHVRYSQEARQYVFLVLGAVLMFWAAWRFSKRPSWRNRGSYIAVAFCLMATHVMGTLFVLVHALLTLFFLLPRPRLSIAWAKTAGLVFLTGLPWLGLLFFHSRMKVESGFWQPAPDGAMGLEILRSLVYTEMPSVQYLLSRGLSVSISYIPIEHHTYVPFALLWLVGFGILWRRERRVLWLAIFPLLAFFILSIGISFVMVPVFALRTMTPCLLGGGLVYAACLTPRHKGWKNGVMHLAAGFCLGLTGLSLYTEQIHFKKEDWRGAIRAIAEQSKPRDPVCYWNYISGLGVDYYAAQEALVNPIYGFPQTYEEAFYTQGEETRESTKPLFSLPEGERLWMVKFRQAPDYTPMADALQNQGYDAIQVLPFVSIDVILYLLND